MKAKSSPAYLTPYLNRYREQGEVRGFTSGKLVLPAKPTDALREEFCVKMLNVEQMLNQQLMLGAKRFNIPQTSVQVDLSRERSLVEQGEKSRALETFLRMKQTGAVRSGWLHDTTVAAAVETFYRCQVDGRSFEVKGAQQAGKSGYVSALMLLGPLTFVHMLAAGVNPIRYSPVIFLPNMNDLEQELSDTLKNFFGLFGGMDIVSASGKISASTYYDRYRHYIHGGNAIEFGVYESRVLSRSVEDGLDDVILSPKVPIHLVSKRERGSLVDACDWLQKAVERGFEPVISGDESHWGIDENSVTDKLFKRPFTYRGQPTSIKAVVVDPDAPMRFIGPSATPVALKGKKADVQHQQLPIGQGYSGLPFDNGTMMSVLVNGKRVEAKPLWIEPKYVTVDDVIKAQNGDPTRVPLVGVRSFSDIATLFGICFDHMSGRAYADSDVFTGRKGAFDLAEWGHAEHKDAAMQEHNDYRDWFHERLADFVKAVTSLKTDGVNFDDVIMRLIPGGAGGGMTTTDTIVEAIKPLLPGITVIRWYGKWYGNTTQKKRLVEVVRDSRVPGVPMVIVVCNKARMGSVMPGSVRHALDLVNRPAHQVSVDQAWIGRLSGYIDGCLVGKAPNWAYFNDAEAERVRKYLRGRGDIKAGRPPQKGVRREISGGQRYYYFERTGNDECPKDAFYNKTVELLESCFDPCKPLEHQPERLRRHLPLFRIAEEVGLFDYVQQQDGVTLFPLPTEPTKGGSWRVTYATDEHRGRSGRIRNELNMSKRNENVFGFKQVNGRHTLVWIALHCVPNHEQVDVDASNTMYGDFYKKDEE